MFDTKTSCLIRGITGVIFGFLALMLPDITLGTFYGLFWVLVILGIAIFIFLAVTANGDESMFWFGLAAAQPQGRSECRCIAGLPAVRACLFDPRAAGDACLIL